MPIGHGWKTRTKPVEHFEQETVPRNDSVSRITGCRKGSRINIWDIYVYWDFYIGLINGTQTVVHKQHKTAMINPDQGIDVNI